MASNNTRAVQWVRVSTEDQAKYGTSPETQKRLLDDFAYRQGLEVVKTFTAVETGKYKEDKKFFTELIDYTREETNDFGVLLVLKIDRAGRNLKQWTELHEILKGSGRVLIAVEQGINTSTIQGQLQANLMMSFAEYERQDIIEKTKKGTIEVLRRGMWPKMSPTGFQKDRTSQSKCRPDIPKEPEYTYIKRIFELFLTARYTSEEVRLIVEDEGFKVSKQTMSKILHNRFYCGYVYDEKNQINVKGVHYDHRILDLEDFLHIQDMLDSKNKNKRTNKQGHPDFFLARTLKCAGCQKVISYGYSKSHTGRKYGYYYCKNSSCKAKQKLPMKAAHDIFYEYLDNLSVNREHIERIKNAILEKAKGNEVKDSLDSTRRAQETRALTIERGIEKLELRYTLGEVTDELYFRMKDKLISELGYIKSNLVELSKKQLTETTITQVTYEEIELIPKLYDKRTTNEKKTLNALLFPGGLYILDGKISNPKLNPMFKYFGLELDSDVAPGALPGTQIELREFVDFLKVFHKMCK